MMSFLRTSSPIFVAAIVSAAFFSSGCSDDTDPGAGEGEACETNQDCAEGLACRDSVCVPRAGGTDGGMTDGGMTDGGGEEDTSVPVDDEEYFISYILENVQDERHLYLHDTASDPSDEDVRINPDSVNCLLGCWLSEDLSTFVYASGTGTFDVFKAPVNDQFEVQTDQEELIATEVRSVEVVGNAITYIKTDGEDNIAYFKSLDGGNEMTVGRIGKTTATEGDWFVDPSNDRAVVYNATLQTMDVKIGELGQVVDATTFTIDSTNYQEVSGSYFGGNVPTAISPDGKYMAVLTESAPMDYNACESGDDCTGPGQRCGRFGRCSAIQIVVHFFDMNNLDNLGEPCSADDACGAIHRCDIPAPDQVDKAKCIPRRVVLGLPGDRTQNGQTGCELTEGKDDLFYTTVRPPLSFAPDGSLYAVAGRACGDYNIEQTHIVRMQPDSDSVEMVLGNPGQNFDESKCYDDSEQTYLDDNPECVVYTEKLRLSPAGNDVVFGATNLEVVDPARAARDIDLWRAKRDGTERTWIGRHATFDEEVVTRFWVHSK